MLTFRSQGPLRTRKVRGLALALLTLSVLGGCVYLPRFDLANVTRALPPSPHSRLAQSAGPDAESISRSVLLTHPEQALRSWLYLIANADRSLDLQYFIVQNDATGLLVVERMLEAADRGVRVRALLDDLSVTGLVDRLQALDDHPNIEIRIFNPFNVRFKYPLGFIRLAEMAIDGRRLNHRMHNKLLVADNQIAILGGRNIGDDYFGRSPTRHFIDTDVLLSGPVVPRLSDGFDSYWNSRWVYPITALPDFSLFPDKLEAVRARIKSRLDEREDLAEHRSESTYDDVVSRLRAADAVDWSRVLVDEPDVRLFQRPDEIAGELAEIALKTRREVVVVTPYLVPTGRLLRIAETLTGRGVRISVLTNSLSTNDVPIAHAMYSNFRLRILGLGVKLHELRSDAEIGKEHAAEELSLHSKFIVFDDDLVFVGSPNLDARSMYLNTELGVLLRSRALAEQLRRSFQTLTQPANAWQLSAGSDGLVWKSTAGTTAEEPAEGTWQRLRNWFFRLFPLHGQT